YETGVASREDPIYSLVVMLPCEYLWYWLATQLQPVKPQNLYAPWVTGNDDSRGPYAIGNFLDSFQKAHPDVLDPQKAIEIYTRATSYEHLNFAAALPAGT
ncbi:MAG TPA: TenA family transcriptional regulator, partial [Thermoanaerobaculia bacterium]|nr:TenA family transcriptional regulator [Thermoanaerobaculia bacterium]